MATEQLAEEVAEHIDEVADVTRSVTGRDMGLVFFGSCVGTVGGIAIGYFLAKSRLETKYAQIAEQEIEELREHYNRKAIALQEKPTVEKMVEDLGYTRSEEEEKEQEVEAGEIDEAEPVVENVFDLPEPETPEWDYATEVKSRSSDHPYVIHVDEFRQNDKGYDQVTYAYYEDDDVLANDRDGVVDLTLQSGLVPPDFVNKFGHGSNDPNVVYIRCDEITVDIEIVRNEGNYGEVVHGFLKHSEERGRRPKPRFDDD